jgi:hypothetical protein
MDSNGIDYKSVPEWHDCDYIHNRNKLIPIAEKYAEEKATSENGGVCSYKFTQYFSTKMDQLAKEHGLV